MITLVLKNSVDDCLKCGVCRRSCKNFLQLLEGGKKSLEKKYVLVLAEHCVRPLFISDSI